MAVQDIQKLLGHTNIATTMEYVYTSDITVKASYNKYIAWEVNMEQEDKNISIPYIVHEGGYG